MANETVITVTGNLTADPELHTTQNGTHIVVFSIAHTGRTYDKQAQQWKDGNVLFMRSSAWRQLGDNVIASLTKGMRVIAQGRLEQHDYTDKNGDKRSSIEMQVDDIGPSLRYATARVTRNDRNSSGTASQPTASQPSASQPSTGSNYASTANYSNGAGFGGDSADPLGTGDQPAF